MPTVDWRDMVPGLDAYFSLFRWCDEKSPLCRDKPSPQLPLAPTFYYILSVCVTTGAEAPSLLVCSHPAAVRSWQSTGIDQIVTARYSNPKGCRIQRLISLISIAMSSYGRSCIPAEVISTMAKQIRLANAEWRISYVAQQEFQR